MNDAAVRFRLMGDEARLRMLRLLGRERLNVSELTSILGLAQSGVSRHLKLLKDGGLVNEQREGGWAFYRALEAPELELVEGRWPEDEARLQEILRHRKEGFREDRRLLVPGRSWSAWARALGHLLPPLRVADLGCGEGYLAVEMSRWASRVVGVDRSAANLERARALARKRRAANLVFRRGSIENLPLESGTFDLALLSQVLHQLEEPIDGLRQAARILAKGGRVVVLELKAHGEAWTRRLGDKRLGFRESTLRRLLRGAGFERIRVEIGSRRRGDPFKVLVASGIKV